MRIRDINSRLIPGRLKSYDRSLFQREWFSPVRFEFKRKVKLMIEKFPQMFDHWDWVILLQRCKSYCISWGQKLFTSDAWNHFLVLFFYYEIHKISFFSHHILVQLFQLFCRRIYYLTFRNIVQKIYNL